MRSKIPDADHVKSGLSKIDRVGKKVKRILSYDTIVHTLRLLKATSVGLVSLSPNNPI